MIHVVTPSSLWNPGVLHRRRQVPRQLLGRGIGPLAWGGGFGGLFWRLVFEYPLLRFTAALAPFPAAALIWPQLAFPLSQAPVALFLMVLFVEQSVLSLSTRERRQKVMDDAERARTMDLWNERGRLALTRLAAARGLQSGEIALVVEQSLIYRVPPLTLISVQDMQDDTRVFMELTPAERADLCQTLLADGLSEARLYRMSLASNQGLHAVTLEPAGISAHARLAARARNRTPAGAGGPGAGADLPAG